MKEIYAVIYDSYNYYKPYGYFTNKQNADKYNAVHSGDYRCRVKTLQCLDDKEDLSNVSLKYQYMIQFNKGEFGWEIKEEPNRYIPYIYDYLHSNFIIRETSKWLTFRINIDKNDWQLAKKTAHSILYQFLDFCNNNPTESATRDMNEILRKDEDERLEKQKQEEIRHKELEELKRLKEKYEMG